MQLLEHRVRAKNTAVAAENKMHDDRVASSFGFRGGLVPGVDVYAYLCHLPASLWGRDWVGRGSMQARFVSPVYDGDEVVASGVLGENGELAMTLRSPVGAMCAEGTARLGSESSTGDRLQEIEMFEGPGRADRPAASAETLAPGRPLASSNMGFHVERTDEYLDDVGETLPLFRSGDVAHPGWLVRQANYLLTDTVRLGPWIHVSTECQHVDAVVDGDRVTTRGRVSSTFERKGHRFVELKVQWTAGPTGTERTVMRGRHLAITEPRGVHAQPSEGERHP